MTEFYITPTFEGMSTSALSVLVLFIGYLIFVGNLATYNWSHTPNPKMLINFIFDNYDGLSKFKEYIRESCRQTSNTSENSSKPDGKTSTHLFSDSSVRNTTIDRTNEIYLSKNFSQIVYERQPISYIQITK